MTNKALLLIFMFLTCGTVMAQEPQVTSLTSKDLPEAPGKEVLIITVEYPPGGADPIHKHNAHGFIYVLEGTVLMQVKGGKQVTLTPGQTWYEGPEDVHVVGRNASSTKPAKFLVFLVKEKGAPVLVPQIRNDAVPNRMEFINYVRLDHSRRHTRTVMVKGQCATTVASEE
jgi:quercetin dioxygenase-like cupin family protein